MLTETKKEMMAPVDHITAHPRFGTTPHVLNVSSTLMGLCFIILTSLKVLGKAEATVIDAIAGFAIFLFMSSCVFSFLSIRIVRKKRLWLESAADILLLCGLSLLFITSMLFFFDIIK